MRLTLVSLFITGSFILTGCQEPEDTALPVTPSVKFEEVGATSGSRIRQISGVLESSNRSELSFQVSGQVEQVLANLGDRVTQDQVLATLSTKDYQLTLSSRQAKLRNARANLSEKQEDYNRKNSLLKQNFTSATVVDQARAALESARAEVDVARTDLRNAELNMTRTTLKAPFDGKISRREVEPFTEINAGQVLFEIQGENSLKARVLVPETLIREVSYGQPVDVEFPTLPDTKQKGIVSEVGFQVATGNAFPVRIDLLQANDKLLPGMTAKVSFLFGDDQNDTPVYLIPLSAIDIRSTTSEKGSANRDDNDPVPIFVFNPESSTVERRFVKTRDIRHNKLEVVEGLSAGEKVITAGVAFLQDGQKVQLWQP